MTKELLDDLGEKAVAEAANYKWDLVDNYLQKGANINHVGPKNSSILWHAVVSNEPVIVQKYISKGAKFSSNAILGFALEWCSGEVATLLVNQIDDIDTILNEGQTALHMAACNADIKFLKAVLLRKPNLNVQDRRLDTPLHEAATRSFFDHSKLLLDAGAHANITNRYGKTPREVIPSSQVKLIELLEQAECEPLILGPIVSGQKADQLKSKIAESALNT